MFLKSVRCYLLYRLRLTRENQSPVPHQTNRIRLVEDEVARVRAGERGFFFPGEMGGAPPGGLSVVAESLACVQSHRLHRPAKRGQESGKDFFFQSGSRLIIPQ